MKNSAKRKLYSIVRTNLGSEILVMHTASRVRAKLGGMTH